VLYDGLGKHHSHQGRLNALTKPERRDYSLSVLISTESAAGCCLRLG